MAAVVVVVVVVVVVIVVAAVAVGATNISASEGGAVIFDATITATADGALSATFLFFYVGGFLQTR